MPDERKKPVKQSDWLKLMLEGQLTRDRLTRDRVLRTKAEIEEDKRRAEELDSRRQALHRRREGADQP
jgi:hypothetical protein